MAAIADLVVKYSADTKDFESGSSRVGSAIDGLASKGKLLAAAGGAAVGAFFANSIMSAANFDQAMSGAAASLGGVGVSGGITTDQLSKMSDEALRIGQTTTMGATDAAMAMDLLAKGGVSYQQIMEGAALSAVQVAVATDTSLDQSSQSMAAFSTLFQTSNQENGVSFQNMADMVTNAMNTGGMTMSEFQTGMTNMTPLILGTGMSFQEAAGMMSFFNANGMAAAEVGTSLTRAYLNLIDPSADMVAAQQEMGLAVYDSAGQFRGLPAILDDVRTHTEGMTDAARDEYLTRLFGAEALDVVTAALESQEGALEDNIKTTGKAGSAAANMATRMDNLKGDIENLKGAFETLSIKVGRAFTPALRVGTQAITGMLTGAMKFVEELKLMYDTGNVFTEQWVKKFPGWAQPVVRAIVGIHEAFQDVIDAFQDLKRGDFSGFFRELSEAGRTAWDALTGLASAAWDGLVGAFGAIDWGQVWNIATSAISSIASAGLEVGTAILNVGARLGGALAGVASNVWGWVKGQLFGTGGVSNIPVLGGATAGAVQEEIGIGTALLNVGAELGGKLKEIAGDIWGWVKSQLGIGGSGVGNIPVLGGATAGAAGYPLDIGDVLLDAKVSAAKLISNVKTAIDNLVTQAKGFISDHESEIMAALDKLFDWKPTGDIGQRLGERFGDWLNGLDWGGLFGKALELQTKIMTAVGTVFLGAAMLLTGVTGQVAAFVGGFVVGMFERIEWSRATSLVGDKFREVFQGASDRVSEALQGVSNAISEQLGRAADAAKAALSPVTQAFDSIARAAGNGVAMVKNFITEGANKLSGIGDTVAGYLSPITTALDAISAAIDLVVDKWNSLPIIGGGGGDKEENNFAPAPPPSGGGGGGKYLLAQGFDTGGVLSQVQTSATQIGQAMAQLASAVQAGARNMMTALTPVGTAFKTLGVGVQTAATQMSSIVRTQFTTMQVAVTTTSNQIATTTRTNFTNMQTAITTAMNQAKTAVTTATGQMSTALSTFATTAATAGQRAGTDFGRGVTDGVNVAVRAAQRGAIDIQAALDMPSLYNDGYSTGSSLGEGIAAGLYSQLNAVASAAAALVNAANAGAQARGEINSPSRLMAREVGAPLALGIAAGMDSQRSAVARSFAGLIPMDSRNGRSGIGSGLAPHRGGGSVQNVTIITLEPGKWQEYLKKADRGDIAYQQQQPRARGVALGLTRR